MARDNILFQDALALLLPSKKDGIPLPPLGLSKLIKVLNTYAAKLWTQYGSKCDHYVQVFRLIGLMESDIAEEAENDFSPMLCATIFWEIIEDARRYFSVVLHPDDFLGGSLVFPTSTLVDLSRNILRQTPLEPNPRFPEKWRAAATVINLPSHTSLEGKLW